MEAKKLKDYFLSGSMGLCIAGIIGTILSAAWLVLKYSFEIGFVKIYFWEIILLIAGPVLLIATIKDTIKASSLLSKLKRSNLLSDVYRSFSNTDENVSFGENAVIISDNYLFIKDEVAIIPYQELVKVRVKCVKNDKKEITAMQLYCNTVNKKNLPIFRKAENPAQIAKFIEIIKQKNSNIIVAF